MISILKNPDSKNIAQYRLHAKNIAQIRLHAKKYNPNKVACKVGT